MATLKNSHIETAKITKVDIACVSVCCWIISLTDNRE